METTFVDRVLGSDVDYVTAAVPLFFTLAFVEFALGLLGRAQAHRLNDSLSDLSCGILDQTLKVFLHAVFLAVYVFVYERYAIFDVVSWSPAGKWFAAFLCFLGVDFCFYWHHRFAHVFAVPWATHVVHHQSEDFNLIVALRQSALEHYLTSFMYLPLAWFGFPPAWYVAMFAFNLIWQFWCHTRLVKRLGPLEWVFNTPSHHRVHHGRNPKYLDKNYAGTLILWDRMFGTFQPEEEEPVYGVTRPLNSWNPLWANVHYWVELAQMARQTPYAWDKIKIWFMPLGWTPRGVVPKPPAPEVDAKTVHKYDVRPPLGMTIYIVAHFLGMLLIGLTVTDQAHLRPLRELLPPSAFIIWTMTSLSGLMERRVWAYWTEYLRLAVFFAGACLQPEEWGAPAVVVPIAAAVAGGSVAWIWLHRLVLRAGDDAVCSHPEPLSPRGTPE